MYGLIGRGDSCRESWGSRTIFVIIRTRDRHAMQTAGWRCRSLPSALVGDIAAVRMTAALHLQALPDCAASIDLLRCRSPPPSPPALLPLHLLVLLLRYPGTPATRGLRRVRDQGYRCGRSGQERQALPPGQTAGLHARPQLGLRERGRPCSRIYPCLVLLARRCGCVSSPNEIHGISSG